MQAAINLNVIRFPKDAKSIRALWWGATAVTFFAMWLSRSYIGLLIGIVGTSFLHGCLLTDATLGKLNSKSLFRRDQPVSWFILSQLAVGIITEPLLRNIYRFYIKTMLTYDTSYKTRIDMDLRHIGDTLLPSIQLLWHNHFWWWVFGFVLVSVVLWRLSFNTIRKRFDFLIAGFSVTSSTLYFLSLLGTDWLQRNEFNLRYFIPMFVLFSVGASFFTARLLEMLPHQRVVKSLLATCIVMIAATSLLGPATENAETATLRAHARTAASKYPGIVVLGGYWGTYVFQALAKPGELIALPAEGQYLRTPQNVEHLHNSTEVLISHVGFDEFGTVSDPLKKLTQYGVVLTLKEREPLGSKLPFSLYEVQRN